VPPTLLVDAVGSCIAIDLSLLDEDDRAAVREAWADARADASALPIATVTPSRTPQAAMLSHLSQEVTLAAIEAARGRAWMLHASGIAAPDGQVVVLVGPSGTGKTTASRALGTTFGYVSDETVAIDEDGRVWAYRKPLSVIEDATTYKRQVAPSALGLQPLPDAELRVAAVVLLDRDARHPESPVVEVTDLGDALGELVGQTSFLHHHPAPLRFIAGLAQATGGIRTVRYREAATLEAAMPELFRHAAERIQLPPLPQHGLPAAGSSSDGPRLTRVEVADEVALHEPDRIALLTIRESGQGDVTVLAGIAPAVWRAAAEATLGQLVSAAVRTYGAPDDGDAAQSVLIAVGHLLEAGLLRSDEPTLSRSADSTWVEGEDRTVALPPGTTGDGGMPVPAVLEGWGALIWEWLAEPTTLTRLTARAAEAAPHVDSRELSAQVTAIVERLIEAGVISPRPAV
jgi:hypothetical protein